MILKTVLMMLSLSTIIQSRALADGGISSGTPPIKTEIQCTGEFNVSLMVHHGVGTPNVHSLSASGPFGKLVDLPVTRTNPTQESPELTFSAERLLVQVLIPTLPKRGSEWPVVPGRLTYQPGDAIFSSQLECTVIP